MSLFCLITKNTQLSADLSTEKTQKTPNFNARGY